MQFSFNAGRSRDVWQGFSTRWYSTTRDSRCWHDPRLQHALLQSLKLAGLDMLIATPLGVLLALGPRALARPARRRVQLPHAVPAGDAGDGDGRLAAAGLHACSSRSSSSARPPRCWATSPSRSPTWWSSCAAGCSRSGGHTRKRPRDLGATPCGDAAAGAAAAAAAGDLLQPADRVRDLDRRLRDQPLPLLRLVDCDTVPIQIYCATRAARRLPSLNAFATIMVLVTLSALVVACLVYTHVDPRRAATPGRRHGRRRWRGCRRSRRRSR